MSMFQELEYNEDVERVSKIQFSIMSPEEIRRRSVAEIHTNETFDGDIPKVGGIFDPRMGVLEHGRVCPTDELNNRHCPGYFGHLELAMPVFYIHFQKWVIKVLQVICPKCSKTYFDADSPEVQHIMSIDNNEARFVAFHALCNKIKKKTCGDRCHNGCGTVYPNSIKKEPSSIAKLAATWKSKDSDPLVLLWNAKQVFDILAKISDSDNTLMGFDIVFSKPEWLICSVLPISPPYVRPSVRADNNTRMEDDLTHKYCDIIKTNKTLKAKLAKPSTKASTIKAIDEWYQLLQYHVATLVNNHLPGIPPATQRSGRPLKAIYDRLKSKEGRVRGNLMGKRVDFSARSVITPDPRLNIDQLGVPMEICKNLTFAEKVHKYNYARLSACVKRGYDKHPGAKSIKRRNNGKIISLSVVDTSTITLEYGDIVNRHLCYDDVVLFNRQPSLHKMSMMQHRVVPLKYKTFRLNVSVTTPYNADFDGDEMNMHVPQSEASRIELIELASVPSQIISPGNHKPIISLVQDTCVGSYLFTREDNFMTASEVYDILSDLESWDCVLPIADIQEGDLVSAVIDKFPLLPIYKYSRFIADKTGGPEFTANLWGGQCIISLIMPEINFVKKNKSYDNDPRQNNIVSITNGVVRLGGIFDKNILGASSQGLIHTIFNDYGKDRTKKFLNDMENIITNFVLKSGFSVGIGDLIPDSESQKKMKALVSEKKRQVSELIDHTHKGIVELKGHRTVAEAFESQMLGILNKTTTETGTIALKSLNSSNRMLNMITSGSKGSEINMGQMIACVGQQAVEGKRIPMGFTDRTLPHFTKYDDGAAARGFVESSFMTGLSPTEFFFHAMGGREGLIDTAVKTSKTGYIQRKLIKALEDARVVADLTVRDSNGNIIQYLYGYDGFAAEKVEKQYIETVGKSDRTIVNEYNVMKNDLKKGVIKSIVDTIDEKILATRMREYIKCLIADRDYYFEHLFNGIIDNSIDETPELDTNTNVSIDNMVVYPINIKRILTNVEQQFEIPPKTDLDPLYILDSIEALRDTLKLSKVREVYNTELLLTLCRIYLNPKRLCIEKHISKSAFDYLIHKLREEFFDAIVANGELVGTIAGQSIGEPSTQMTLNTFHFAGVASKSSVNQGVPRLEELLSVTENLKGPMNTIVLKEPYCYSKEHTQSVLDRLPLTYIKELVSSTEIYFKSSNADDELPKLHALFENTEDKGNICPWVLKLIINRSKLADKNIKMREIYIAISKKFNTNKETVNCYYSADNASSLYIKIQPNIKRTDIQEAANCEQDNMIGFLKTMEKTIMNDIILRGISKISGATMIADENNVIFKNGTYIKKKKWTIYTEGSNLQEIFSHTLIDNKLSISNNIKEVNRVLGIEAARNMLFREITEVFDNAGSYISERHIALLVDVMTNRGRIMSVDRHGINKTNRGPLAKCSFEETPDILARASIFSEVDKMESVSSNIMLGQEVPIGTGAIDILFDEEAHFEMDEAFIGEAEEERESESILQKTQYLKEYCKKLFD